MTMQAQYSSTVSERLRQVPELIMRRSLSFHFFLSPFPHFLDSFAFSTPASLTVKVSCFLCIFGRIGVGQEGDEAGKHIGKSHSMINKDKMGVKSQKHSINLPNNTKIDEITTESRQKALT